LGCTIGFAFSSRPRNHACCGVVSDQATRAAAIFSRNFPVSRCNSDPDGALDHRANYRSSPMSEVTPGPKQIFLNALERNSPEDLLRYLDEACRGNADLRSRVEALLRAHRDVGNFLGGPPAPNPTADGPAAEKPGTMIGPYKLLQQIGEGGFGIVYMAEQAQPVRRQVALKVLKPGMDMRQVVARFEAERQALPLMDHPNIAKVMDAGATENGHPYFVMELVKGIPITHFCDEHNLTPRERLELFLPVCHSVQHAHQKGVIHRDLKPSNVLVALYDD